MKTMAAVFFVLATITSQLSANSYAGISYAGIDLDEVDFTAVNAHAGFEINDFIAIEGRYQLASSSETLYGANVEIEDLYGVYAKVFLPFSDSFSPYLIAGKTYGTATATYQGYSASASDSGTSMGIGVKFQAREALSISVETMQLMDDIDQVSIILASHF